MQGSVIANLPQIWCLSSRRALEGTLWVYLFGKLWHRLDVYKSNNIQQYWFVVITIIWTTECRFVPAPKGKQEAFWRHAILMKCFACRGTDAEWVVSQNWNADERKGDSQKGGNLESLGKQFLSEELIPFHESATKVFKKSILHSKESESTHP